MESFIESEKRRHIKAGIINQTFCYTREAPTRTFLGSTDKKGYEVETVCQYLDQHQIFFTRIEPWDASSAKEIIEHTEESSKFKFADTIYLKLFN